MGVVRVSGGSCERVACVSGREGWEGTGVVHVGGELGVGSCWGRMPWGGCGWGSNPPGVGSTESDLGPLKLE